MAVASGPFAAEGVTSCLKLQRTQALPRLRRFSTRDLSRENVRLQRGLQRGPFRHKGLLVTNFTHESQQRLAALPVSTEAPKESESSSDVSLPEFQVQSQEEQAQIAATPAHPESLYAVYAIHCASCLLEHAWHFGLPAVIAILHDSFIPVAAEGFVSQLIIFAGGPWLGGLLDDMPRALSFNLLTAIQTVALVVSAAMVVFAVRAGNTTASTSTGILLQPWFIILILSSAVEKLTGLACGVAFERDWVVLLAGANRAIALADANAILRRMDLICEITGPFLFGILLAKYKAVTSTYIAAIAMVAIFPPLMYLVHLTYKFSKGVLDRPRTRSEAKQSSEEGLRAIARGWMEYIAQPIFPASLAFVLLYFNAVLGPGGLMTSFLTQHGLNPSIIGGFRGICASMGFVATFIYSTMIARLGVFKAGLIALLFQAVPLVLAVGVYWGTRKSTHKAALIAFLVLIVVSRLGFWLYDMVDAQIFQTAVPVSRANLVGTTEVSLASLAELVMMGVAMVASDVSHFGALSALSTLAVVGAAWVYWHWLKYPTPEQAKLFQDEAVRLQNATA